MRAVLANDKVDFSKKCRSYRKNTLKLEFLKRSILNICSQYFKLGIVVIMMFFIVSKQNAEEQYQIAEEFYNVIKNCLT